MHLPLLPITTLRVLVVALGVALTAAALAAVVLINPARAQPREEMSLMQTIEEWKYPGSTLLGGATMSDGGNPLVQSVKCHATLTTPDPFDKVIEFYYKKFTPSTARERRGPGNAPDVRPDDAKAVTMADDSEGRPVKLRVIAVNKADTATTLAISRAETEKETHIAWLHYRWIDGKRVLRLHDK
jgi:hypothetical protein